MATITLSHLFLVILYQFFLCCSGFTVGGPFCEDNGTCSTFSAETRNICKKLIGYNIKDTWCVFSDDYQVLGPFCDGSSNDCTSAKRVCQSDVKGDIIGEGRWCIVKKVSDHWLWSIVTSLWLWGVVAISMVLATIYFYKKFDDNTRGTSTSGIEVSNSLSPILFVFNFFD
jgi:hypothetical protein